MRQEISHLSCPCFMKNWIPACSINRLNYPWRWFGLFTKLALVKRNQIIYYLLPFLYKVNTRNTRRLRIKRSLISPFLVSLVYIRRNDWPNGFNKMLRTWPKSLNFYKPWYMYYKHVCTTYMYTYLQNYHTYGKYDGVTILHTITHSVCTDIAYFSY